MNDDTAMSIVTVYTCIAILCDAIATLPVNAYKRTRDRTKLVIDPPPPLVANPWPEGSLQDWLTQVVVSLALRGNFFGQIVDRGPNGYPTMIKPVHPDRVFARRDINSGQRVYRFDGAPVPTDDVVHIPALLVPGSFVGLNPVEYMRGSWALAAATERYGGQFFANSANPSGVITVEEDLTSEETLELARDWRMQHGGIANAQYPAVLTGGAQWHQIAINPDDAQFLQTRDFQRHEIASFYRIPEHMLGFQDRTSSWGTGIEQMEIGFVINTLRPWLSRIETYLTNITPPSQMVKFNLAGRLRGDTLQRFQAYTLARNGGWMNIDEIRELEDLPALPDGQGQDYWAPLNFAPISAMQAGNVVPGSTGGIGGGVGNSPNAPPAPPAPGSDDF
jgi:HK97 family phage portal protein